jgi:phosphatidylserine/phosphatidylglycerophosphate/cardiolipin synthase-like enzyme
MTVGMKQIEIDIAVSGKYWVGDRGSILTVFRNISNFAKKEVQFSIYSFGKKIPEFSNLLNDLLKKDIKIQIIVNKFSNQPKEAKRVLLNLKSTYDNLTILDFNPKKESDNLHAKIIVVDRIWALIGSSNISWHGYISNHELAIVIRGEKAEQIAELLDKLARSSVTEIIEQ